MIEETDTSGNLQRAYIFFDKRRIAWRDPQGVYYYFTDTVGSTRVVTDSSGSVCFDADYYPYGQEIDFTNSCSPTYKFAGYEYDSETGNYYAYARYYDPRLGRFLSPDPLGGAMGNPQSLNRYSYVVNNPESLVDPTGMNCGPWSYESWGPNGTLHQFESGYDYSGCAPPPPPSYQSADAAFQLQVDAIDNGGWGAQGPLAVGTAQTPIQRGHGATQQPTSLPVPPFPSEVHQAFQQWGTCVRGDAVREVGSEAVKNALDGERRNVPADILGGFLKAEASCLKENPLAALDHSYEGPPAGDVFVPPPFPFNLEWPY